jgi:hypothetical protein
MKKTDTKIKNRINQNELEINNTKNGGYMKSFLLILLTGLLLFSCSNTSDEFERDWLFHELSKSYQREMYLVLKLEDPTIRDNMIKKLYHVKPTLTMLAKTDDEKHIGELFSLSVEGIKLLLIDDQLNNDKLFSLTLKWIEEFKYSVSLNYKYLNKKYKDFDKTVYKERMENDSNY